MAEGEGESATGAKWVLELVQGLPVPGKSVVTLVIALLAILAVYLLWQKPLKREIRSVSDDTTKSLKQDGEANAGSIGQQGGTTIGKVVNQSPPISTIQKNEE